MTRPSRTKSILLSTRRMAGRVARRLGFRRPADRPSPVASAPGPPKQASRVDLISPREIVGALELGPDSAPVTLRLFVNEVEVDHVDVAPSGGTTAPFRFRTRDMWRYCGPNDRVTVRSDAIALPMPDGSLHYSPSTKAKQPLSKLEARLAAGEIVNSLGVLSTPKYLDHEWQSAVTSLYRDIDRVVYEITGYHPFLVYGSLLGLVREGRPLGHDHDFDAAYLSALTDPKEVVAEAGRLALALQERGFSIEARATCIHIADASREHRIDLYHFFFNALGELRLAWGSVSETPFRVEQWHGLEKVEFAGATVFAPRNREDLVAHFYGPNWRVPNPGFNWQGARKARAKEAAFPSELRPIINWQDYWLHNSFDTPSSLARFVKGLNLALGLVVDLGCGDGRDAPSFVRSGAYVLGLDYTPAAIESARTRRIEQATFERCDFSAPGELREQISSLPQPRPRTLFYARHLLDSVPESTESTLLAELKQVARPEDTVVFEFRTPDDDTLHYHDRLNCGRRTVDPGLVRERLADAGFETTFDVSSSSWEHAGSKPIFLHRIVATKT